MQVNSIAEWEHSAILLTCIKPPFVINIFVLSIFRWPFYTGFTVYCLFRRMMQREARYEAVEEQSDW